MQCRQLRRRKEHARAVEGQVLPPTTYTSATQHDKSNMPHILHGQNIPYEQNLYLQTVKPLISVARTYERTYVCMFERTWVCSTKYYARTYVRTDGQTEERTDEYECLHLVTKVLH
jgi:hypothetical protein